MVIVGEKNLNQYNSIQLFVMYVCPKNLNSAKKPSPFAFALCSWSAFRHECVTTNFHSLNPVQSYLKKKRKYWYKKNNIWIHKKHFLESNKKLFSLLLQDLIRKQKIHRKLSWRILQKFYQLIVLLLCTLKF